MTTANSKDVYVVFGRNKRIKREIFAFLKMLSLSPIPWEEAVLSTSRNASYAGETLEMLLQKAQAVVILLTGDDEAQVRTDFSILSDVREDDMLFLQPRPNVVFEAGMVFSHSWLAPRTILVEVGKVRLCNALNGRHRLKLSNKMEDRWALVRSLQSAGCTLEIPSNRELREVGDFE